MFQLALGGGKGALDSSVLMDRDEVVCGNRRGLRADGRVLCIQTPSWPVGTTGFMDTVPDWRSEGTVEISND